MTWIHGKLYDLVNIFFLFKYIFKNIIKKNSTPDLKGDKVVRRLSEEVYF